MGYRVDGRKLYIVPEDAELVHTIFRLYLEAGNVRLLKERLDRMGLHNKPQTSSDGTVKVSPFSRGALYTILSNIIYIGKIRHKDAVYDGLHDAIIDQDLWDRVHAELASNANGTKKRVRKTEAAPLAKKLYDDEGKALVRVDSSKNGRRYRYYVSQKLLIKSDGTGWRLPGKEIEATLLHATRKLMKDPAALSFGLLDANIPIAATSEIIKASVEMANRMTDGVLCGK